MALPRRAAVLGSALFFLVGPGLEAGLGPFLVTGGWDRGSGTSPALTVAGALLIVGGLVVLVRCFADFALRGQGTPTPAAPTATLVTGGPYAVVRNPQHLATAVVVLGQALVLARPVLVVAVAAYLGTLGLLVRRYEEPRLRERFGPAYDAYRAATPAWVPRPRRGRAPGPTGATR
ncbi:isoprenylcysteine carboxylmethyltransferase family protein [Conexibacter sp. W3-3-2]|uniref:methyltransferase family protein n=1 Tax=Conexibacter sp. W3-3-2 TaxID=2675227 RepID=UPI001E56243F|nr:isoprenylcysteine carboxylmethyltransferase family protein [Conexibacter sp. W3-3-2]